MIGRTLLLRWARRLAPAALCALACAGVARADAGVIAGSPLALRTIREAVSPRLAPAQRRGDGREDWLAQRVITREWGYSEDTSYVEVEVPGYRSEGGAALLSAVVPGAGELYVGESSGLVFALAEVAAWTARILFDHRADQRRDAPQKFAGSPYDPASAWTFARYEQATQGDTTALERLYSGDRDAFYHRIGFEDAFGAGWSSIGARDNFRDLEDEYQNARRRVRYATGAIILVHVVSALDALHAAREHNLPLERNLRLKLGGVFDPRGDSMTLALETRF